MTVNEVRAAISQGTGIPEYKLPDATPGAIIQHAQTILAQQRQEEAQRPKSTADQFAEWFNAQQGIDPQADRYAAAQAAIDSVVEQLRVDAGGYPIIRDGGSSGVTLGDCRPSAEQFAEFINNKLAFDPRTDADGWTRLTQMR